MKLLLLKGADRKMSVLLEGGWGREGLVLFYRLWIARERSGQNGISHPCWEKISDDTNGRVNLPAKKRKFKVLSATLSLQLHINTTEYVLTSLLPLLQLHLLQKGKGYNSVSTAYRLDNSTTCAKDLCLQWTLES